MHDKDDLPVGADAIRNSVFPIWADWLITGWQEGNILWRKGLRVTILDMENRRAYFLLLNDRIAIFTFAMHELRVPRSEQGHTVSITFRPAFSNVLEIALEVGQVDRADCETMLEVARALDIETHAYLLRRMKR